MDWKVFWQTLAIYLSERLKERSTYLGLIALAAACGLTLTPELALLICSIASAVSGAILVATADKKKIEMGAGTDDQA